MCRFCFHLNSNWFLLSQIFYNFLPYFQNVFCMFYFFSVSLAVKQIWMSQYNLQVGQWKNPVANLHPQTYLNFLRYLLWKCNGVWLILWILHTPHLPAIATWKKKVWPDMQERANHQTANQVTRNGCCFLGGCVLCSFRGVLFPGLMKKNISAGLSDCQHK